ncbi:MAG: CoA transferase, partial [Solimonas sp.]
MSAAPAGSLRAPPAGADERLALAYRDRLFDTLGARPARRIDPPYGHPARAWARSGLMALTGTADGPPQMCPLPIAAAADGTLAALASLAPQADFSDLGGARLLSERAALMSLRRAGAVSAGGACRLLQAADGRLGLSLARDDDWSLLPAWLEAEVADWDAVAACVRERGVDALVERGRQLGLAVAASRSEAGAPPWARVRVEGPRGDIATRRMPLVVDLSSLWAGPLCSHLLQRCGAEVIKVESAARPDGARRGAADFFDLLNAGKRSVTLDLQSSRGRAQLLALLRRADIVIEASRPRALRQMGIAAEALLHDRANLSWISIGGYGRDEPQAQWIAYGDDAGVAAGLSAVQQTVTGSSMFVGDAIGDPLTGLHAALAAWASHRAGGSRLISLALSDVVRHVAAFDRPADDAALRARQAGWSRAIAASDIRPPQPRRSASPARPLGADTSAVLS